MYQNKKIVATIEARMTSTRLPGKVLMDLAGKPVLQHIVERLKRSKYIDDVVIATTINDTDKPIITLCEQIGCSYYRGSEEDVLQRVLDAAKSVKADLIVEITGDNPFTDWRHTDVLIEMFHAGEYDYAANVLNSGFPHGLAVQVFPVAVLDEANRLTQDPADHEHVSLYIYSHPERYRLVNWLAPEELRHPELHVTLDTPSDYQLIKNVYEALYPINPDFSAVDVVNYLLAHPEVADLVADIKRKKPHE